MGTALTDKAMPVAVRRAKYNDVRVTVLIDTLGKPAMKHFTVVEDDAPLARDEVQEFHREVELRPRATRRLQGAEAVAWRADGRASAPAGDKD
jgi:hypothetical protein